MFHTQRIASKRNAPQGKATRETAVQTAVFRGVFTSTAKQGIEAQIGARQGIAKQIGQPIAVGFSMCFHIKRAASQGKARHRRAVQSSAAFRAAVHRKANRAAHCGGFLDVFSHQLQCKTPLGIEMHRNARNRSAQQCSAKQIGLAIGNSGFPDVFSHQLQTAAQGIAAHDNARHRIAKHPGLGIRKSALARSF